MKNVSHGESSVEFMKKRLFINVKIKQKISTYKKLEIIL